MKFPKSKYAQFDSLIVYIGVYTKFPKYHTLISRHVEKMTRRPRTYLRQGALLKEVTFEVG